MRAVLKLVIFILLILQTLMIILAIKNKKISIKYGIFWFILIFVMLIALIFNEAIYKLSDFLGFEIASNMLFLFGFFFLLFLCFVLSISISNQNRKIKLLIEEVSLLKKINEKSE